MAAIKRLLKEMKDIQNKPQVGCSAAFINESDPYKWKATIFGPENTPYEGGVFELSLTFPTNYPFQPPNVKFDTKVFHPNIDSRGSICLDILKDQWSPALQTTQLLLSLSSLLADPNADDPLDSSAAKLYKNDRHEYNKKVKSYVATYASGPSKK